MVKISFWTVSYFSLKQSCWKLTLSWSKPQSAAAAPDQIDIRLLEITRFRLLSFIIRGVIRQVMERRAVSGLSFLIKRVITMQILTLCCLTCLKDKYHFSFLSRRETPAHSRASEFRRWSTLFNSQESPKWIKWVIKFAVREWWSFGLPPLHLLPTSHPPTPSFSLNMAQTAVLCLLECFYFCLSSCFIFFHLIFATTVLLPHPTCLRQSHSFSLLSDSQWSMGKLSAVKTTAGERRSVKYRELKLKRLQGWGWVTELRALDSNKREYLDLKV